MRLQTRIPPPVYALLSALLMWGLHYYWPILHWLSAPWHWGGLGIMALALSLDIGSVGLFWRARTTVNPLQPENSRHLVTNGLYQYTRNPMYVGMLIMLLGWWVFLGSLSPGLVLPLFIWGLTEMQIKPEERILQAKFGQAYVDYQAKVRRWL